MAAYLAMRIIKGKVDYKKAIEAYPECKEDIDKILIAEGKQDLIVQ